MKISIILFVAIIILSFVIICSQRERISALEIESEKKTKTISKLESSLDDVTSKLSDFEAQLEDKTYDLEQKEYEIDALNQDVNDQYYNGYDDGFDDAEGK